MVGLVRRQKPLWEQEPSLGGLFRTAKDVLFSPKAFFRDRDQRGGIALPFLFGVIHGTLGGCFPFLLAQSLGGKKEIFPGVPSGLVLVFIVAALVAMGLFINSGVIHVGLMLVGGDKKGYRATFRAVAYAQAAQLWEVIPFFGPFLAGFYQIYLYLVGLRELHQIGISRVLLGMLLPLLLGGVLLALAFVALFWPFLRDFRGSLPL